MLTTTYDGDFYAMPGLGAGPTPDDALPLAERPLDALGQE